MYTIYIQKEKDPLSKQEKKKNNFGSTLKQSTNLTKKHPCLTFYWRNLVLLQSLMLFDPKQVTQIDFWVNIVMDLALIEEAWEVRFHLGTSGDSHAQSK